MHQPVDVKTKPPKRWLTYIKGGLTEEMSMMRQLEELREKYSKRWRFVQDDDGHWYQIPADELFLFQELLDVTRDEDHPRYHAAAIQFDALFFKRMLGTGIEGITFTNPEEDK